MKMQSLPIAMLLWLFIGMPLYAECDTSFVITARTTQFSGKRLAMQISIKNITNVPIRIFSASLPWRYGSSTIYILRTAAGTLHESGFISHGFPIAGETVINPGEELSGMIDLGDLFPQLALTIEKDGGLLFWSFIYNPLGASSTEAQLYGGVVLLQRARSEPHEPAKAR